MQLSKDFSKPAQKFAQRPAFKPAKRKAPLFALYINDKWRGVFESEDLAELHAHELQYDGLQVKSLLIVPTDGETPPPQD